MNELAEIQDWFQKNCNGVWEHTYGVSIQSTDNPGWWVKINLAGTKCETKAFATISHGTENQGRWVRCYVDDNVFNGAGDPQSLFEILRYFLSWSVMH